LNKKTTKGGDQNENIVRRGQGNDTGESLNAGQQKKKKKKLGKK